MVQPDWADNVQARATNHTACVCSAASPGAALAHAISGTMASTSSGSPPPVLLLLLVIILNAQALDRRLLTSSPPPKKNAHTHMAHDPCKRYAAS
jgi:hypothetical protein